MKAVAMTKPVPGHIDYLDWDEPQVGPGDVLIRVKAAGICGTDISLYNWSENMVQTLNAKCPFIMGHEFAGEVAAVGKNVQGFAPGDRVTANPIIYCGECAYCAKGAISVCPHREFLGSKLNGVFAEYVTVRQRNVYKLPGNLSFEQGALCEPLSAALHFVDVVPPRLGDFAVVIGPGPLGMTILAVLLASGVRQVMVTGLTQDMDRLKIAESMGAIIVNVEEQDPLMMVREFTEGRGADVVYEAAGHPSGLPQAIQLVRRQGTIALMGLPHLPSQFVSSSLVFEEKTVVGVRAYTPANWDQCVRLLRVGALNIEPLITHRFPLAEAQKGFEAATGKKGLKVMLIP